MSSLNERALWEVIDEILTAILPGDSWVCKEESYNETPWRKAANCLLLPDSFNVGKLYQLKEMSSSKTIRAALFPLMRKAYRIVVTG